MYRKRKKIKFHFLNHLRLRLSNRDILEKQKDILLERNNHTNNLLKIFRVFLNHEFYKLKPTRDLKVEAKIDAQALQDQNFQMHFKQNHITFNLR